jgi:hypothetical protein
MLYAYVTDDIVIFVAPTTILLVVVYYVGDAASFVRYCRLYDDANVVANIAKYSPLMIPWDSCCISGIMYVNRLHPRDGSGTTPYHKNVPTLGFNTNSDPQIY